MGTEEQATAGIPDPGRVATAADLGRELSLAKERAGLTVREAAKVAGIPISTAGDYFAGRHLPSLAQADSLRKLLACCGVEDPAEVSAWIEALRRARRAPGRRPADAPAPYPGLAAFQPQDSAWFFGRDELICLLTDAVSAPGARRIPLIVTGPSGSGKSSVLRAGLIPRLTAAGPGRRILLFTPGPSPLATLAAQLGCLAKPENGHAGEPAGLAQCQPGAGGSGNAHGAAGDISPNGDGAAGTAGQGPADPLLAADRPVFVVDQFEEVFAACPDEGQRRDFIAGVSRLAATAEVVLGLRADFYAYALRYPELARSLQHRQVVIGPMTQLQLREAITEPARRAKLTLEPGLAELVLRDLAPEGEDTSPGAPGHEAGALPFLSHALRMTWLRNRAGRLTVAGYQASGGIQDAIARTADDAYEALGDSERAAARHLFLRLVQVTDDSRLTRARMPLADLGETGDGSADGLLDRFVTARLVTLDADSAQITHEALLSAWPRLRSWIDADRDGVRIRRQITSAARDWQQSGRDDGMLLRSGPLATATEWAADRQGRQSLGALAREFLDAAVAHETAQRAAEQRRTRRLRRLVASLTVLVLMTAGLTGYAFQQREAAATARNQADSREIAVEAGQVRGVDPSLAAQLSLAAYRAAPTPGALASLLASAASPAAARVQDSQAVVESVALAAGRRVLAAAAADGTLRLWNVGRPGHPAPLGRQLAQLRNSPLYTAAFSPDGRLLAAGGAGRVIRLWDLSRPGHPRTLGAPLTGPGNTVYSVAFSPDGRILAAGSADDTVRLWELAGPGHFIPLGSPLTGATGYFEAVAFSPRGRLLAAASADGSVRLWNLADPRRPVLLSRPLTGPSGIADAAAFSPDGRTLAVGARDNSVWLWNVTSPAHPVRARAPLTNATDWVNAVAFSPDGRTLAAASSGNQVLLWNAATGTFLGTLPVPQPVTSLAWDGGRALITGAADGTIRIWDVPAPLLLAGGPVNGVAYGSGGRVLAVAGPQLQLWDARGRRLLASAPPGASGPNTVAFAPSRSLLAAGYTDGTIRLWRATTASLSPLTGPLTASTTGMVEFATFRRGGTLLASTGDDGTVRLWDVRDPLHPGLLATVHDSGTYVFSAAFSPDGRTLAAASADNLTRLWDVTNPSHPRPLGKPLAGPASYAISVAFSPDGHTLAIGSADKTVRLWRLAGPAGPRPLGKPLTGPDGYVYSVAFSPDGRTLAGGVTDGTLWLWNVADPATPALITSLTDTASASAHIYTVAFGPGGTTLAAGSSDGVVRLWDIQPAAAASAVCATAAQPMTRAEWATYAPGRPYDPPCRR